MNVQKLTYKLKDIMKDTKELAHGTETLEWLLKIEPKADWRLQIAALAHDIERAVPYIEGETPPKVDIKDKTFDEYKNEHAKRSAQIVNDIMESMNFNKKDITKICNAIEKHEVGGDQDSDLVRDADSIRWFDTGYKNYISKYGLDGAKEKGWWMYKRATDKIKEIINRLPFDGELKNHITKQSS